jgi:hypothetical protein
VDLSDQLRNLGYDLHEAGISERIEGGRILPVRIYNFTIPLPR